MGKDQNKLQKDHILSKKIKINKLQKKVGIYFLLFCCEVTESPAAPGGTAIPGPR